MFFPKKLIQPPKNVEERLVNVEFNIHKFNNRPRPENKRQNLIISVFSEFGCETIAVMYCIPQIAQMYPGYYKIAMGWYGRAYLYKHLVDEFWEIKEEYQWLRDYCRAFHNISKNLKTVEVEALKYGRVISSERLGRLAVGANCNACGGFMAISDDKCRLCGSTEIRGSLFSHVKEWKKKALRVPMPSEEKMAKAKEYLKPNSVGISARGRTTYGRNLQPEFYVKLIKLLEDKGYNPIWLGEKQSTQPCPVDHIFDFSRTEESKDLELTLAIVSNLKFTVQFWTASTRLAGMMGVPYLIFESPDQIYGSGQEGFRRNLVDFAPRKLVISHYLNVYNDNDGGLVLVDQAIKEMEAENYENIIGMIDDHYATTRLIQDNKDRIGDE